MRRAVVLMTHGSPDSLDDVEPYLKRVMKHRAPTPAFVADIRRRYEMIGGRSPLMDITREQAQLLSRALDAPVAVGALHGRPTIAEAVASLDGASIAGIVAAPHYSPVTVDAYRAALAASAPAAGFVQSWHHQPSFLDAWAERVRGADFVLFTAHSVPVATAGAYPAQVRETIDAIASRVPGLKWDLAWQSRSPGPVEWLEPDVEAKLDECHANEVERILVAPIGFVSDNVEILYDLDRLHAEHAYRLRLRWSRAPMLNTDPRLIEALAAAARGA